MVREYTPTDEQVRIVKRALILADNDGDTRGMSQAVSDAYERGARAALVAVGPSIAAQAWDEGLTHGIAYQAGNNEAWRNPYREQEAR